MNMTKTRVCKQGFRGKNIMKIPLPAVGGTLTAKSDYYSSATKSQGFLWPTVMVEGGGLGGLGRGWVILLDRWYFWPTVIVEGGVLGGFGRGWVIVLDRWYFWPAVERMPAVEMFL